MPTYRTAVVDAVHNDEELQLNLDLLEERCERAAIRKAKAKLKMTKYYNARILGVTLRPGDFVYRSNDVSHAVNGGKLGPKLSILTIGLPCKRVATPAATNSVSLPDVYLRR
ncbi:hypothetical protein Tco_0285018 [Tanacetum coccineum]